MSEVKKPVPTNDELRDAVRTYLGAKDAEQRLYDILDRAPGRHIVCRDNGQFVLLECSYDKGKIRVSDVAIIDESPDLRPTPCCDAA